jgi:hypothetical protein
MPSYEVATGPISIAASTTKTLVDLALPSTSLATIIKWWVGSDATSAGTATSDFRVQVGVFTAAVTTHTATVPNAFDAAGYLLPSNITAGINTTVEGAGTPQTGGTNGGIEEHPLGLTQSEVVIWEPLQPVVKPSGFWRIRLIVPAGIGTTNAYAGVAWTE